MDVWMNVCTCIYVLYNFVILQMSDEWDSLHTKYREHISRRKSDTPIHHSPISPHKSTSTSHPHLHTIHPCDSPPPPPSLLSSHAHTHALPTLTSPPPHTTSSPTSTTPPTFCLRQVGVRAHLKAKTATSGRHTHTTRPPRRLYLSPILIPTSTRWIWRPQQRISLPTLCPSLSPNSSLPDETTSTWMWTSWRWSLRERDRHRPRGGKKVGRDG